MVRIKLLQHNYIRHMYIFICVTEYALLKRSRFRKAQYTVTIIYLINHVVKCCNLHVSRRIFLCCVVTYMCNNRYTRKGVYNV